MAQTADELAADIARTRDDMSNTLDAIGDQMGPKQVAKRGTRRAGQWFQSAFDGVMGSFSDVAGHAGQGQAGLDDGSGESRPGSEALAGQTHGNPLAAGIIAFGIGLLVGSLLRATKVEQQAASAIADKAEPAIDAAMHAASGLAHQVQESTGQVASKVGEVFHEHDQDKVDQPQASTPEPQATVKQPGPP